MSAANDLIERMESETGQRIDANDGDEVIKSQRTLESEEHIAEVAKVIASFRGVGEIMQRQDEKIIAAFRSVAEAIESIRKK